MIIEVPLFKTLFKDFLGVVVDGAAEAEGAEEEAEAETEKPVEHSTDSEMGQTADVSVTPCKICFIFICL